MVVLTHAGAVLVGLVLGVIVAGLVSSAGHSDLHSALIYRDILIGKLSQRIALLEAGPETDPCSTSDGQSPLPDVETDATEGYAGWH